MLVLSFFEIIVDTMLLLHSKQNLYVYTKRSDERMIQKDVFTWSYVLGVCVCVREHECAIVYNTCMRYVY